MDVKKGIYSKEFKFDDNDGLTQTLVLKPLPTKYLPKLFKIASAFQGITPDKTMTILTEENVIDIVELCIATMKRSYPTMTDEDIDGFVSSNFITLFPVIFELNLGDKKK